MLKVNFDSHSGDYLDYFLPFMRYVIACDNKRPVNPKETADMLRKEFGLSIPLHVCERALKRLVKHNFLKREQHAYYVVTDIETQGFDQRRKQGVEVADLVGQRIVEQCRELFAETVSMETAQSMFGAYLRTFSIECVRAYVERTDLPKLSESDYSRRSLYVVNRVVRELRANDERAFQAVITLVKGNMLANALTCEDLESITRKFKGITFYLDTPLILRVLQLDDDAENRSTAELLSLIRKLDGSLAIFSHTLSEVEHVLTTIANGLTRNDGVQNGHRRIFSVLHERHIRPSDILMMKADLQSLLQQKEIPRIGSPPADPKFQINEAELDSFIRSKVNYTNDRARENDVKSISSIYTLRGRTEPSGIEDCVAVMVSSNSNLARTAHDFGKRYHTSERVSAMITDFSLANIAWLKAPLETPSLPEFEIMSACYAAMEPTTPLWDKYLSEIERLRQLGRISSDDHQLLRFESAAQMELMDLTQGSDGYLNGQTIAEILDGVKARLTASKQAEIESANETAKKAYNEAELTRRRWHERNASLRHKALKCASLAISCINIGLALLLIAIGIVGACADLPNLSILWIILVVLGILFGVFTAYSGSSIRSLTEPLKDQLASWIFLRLKRLVADSEDS